MIASRNLDLVYSTIEGLIQYNPELHAECEVQSRTIYCQNGTEIRALSSEYSTASGSNHGWTSWDELWAYTSEGSRRLWEELTSVPTRRNSIRLVSTYAGYTQESGIPRGLIRAGGARWRAHWLRELFPSSTRQRVYLRTGIAARLVAGEYAEPAPLTSAGNISAPSHRNEWVSSESRFIEPEVYDACVDSFLREDLTGALFLGVDVGLKSDSTAIVAVRYQEGTGQLRWPAMNLATAPRRDG